jgi:small subunit ribosomal protein S14
MKFISIKARNIRARFYENESKRLALHFLKNNKNLSSAIRWKASLLLTKFKSSGRSRLSYRCYLTSRSRSYIKLFDLSRVKVRELARDGRLPFINKVSW